MPLIINHIYSQADIAAELDCTIMRGMNYKINTNRLILIRKHINPQYEDRQEGDILYYTGEGQIGNQNLVAANLRLQNSIRDNTEVVLFEVFNQAEYTYKGVVKLYGDIFTEPQEDTENNTRQVYIFPLKILNQEALVNDNNIVQANSQSRERSASNLNNQELQKRVNQTQRKKPGYSYVKTKVYQRSEYVVESALRRANGICERCNQEAPFKKANGRPYLEVHHIVQLSNAGEDTIENVIALCPNCHRELHFGV